MKSHLIFILIGSLLLAGIPSPSICVANPKPLNEKQKAALTALAKPDLLQQKAGDYWVAPPPVSTNNVQKPIDDKFGLGLLVGALGVIALETLIVLGSYRGGGSC